MILANNLSKRFDGFEAVRGVSLDVPPGQLLALLGPNGAGKTTTVRMLTSILKPTGGWARVAGFDVAENPNAVRRHVGVLTEHHGLYFRMRAEEYLAFFGEMYGLPETVHRARAQDLLARFGMRDALKKRLGEYSKGMRQKLALIRTLLHNPPVLLLDEPTSAMDPQSAKLVRDAIAELRRDKRAIILCTHNLTEAEALADQIAIIRRGRIIAQGTLDALRRQLLGQPMMELRLTVPVAPYLSDLHRLLNVEASGDTWVRYRTADPAATNPLVLEWLTLRHVPALTLAEVTPTLESVYLQIQEAAENQA